MTDALKERSEKKKADLRKANRILRNDREYRARLEEERQSRLPDDDPFPGGNTEPGADE